MRTFVAVLMLAAWVNVSGAQWVTQNAGGSMMDSIDRSATAACSTRGVNHDMEEWPRDFGPCGDTFSIAAVDTVTREIGSAGASCIEDVIWISSPFPNLGIVHTQASSDERQRNYARLLMSRGFSPQELIDTLVAYDVPGPASYFQYGVVDMVGGGRSAAYTGSQCYNWKGHLTGPTYAIQGNILLGPQILDSMKARFLNTPGALTERLMAALQGAKVRGADTRCCNSGTSSISAFIRVVRPDDPPNGPYFFELNVDSMYTKEPIDSLQFLFSHMKTQAFLRVDARKMDLGNIDINVPYRDSTFLVRNAGGARDSVYISLDYVTVTPQSAISVSPVAFELAPGQSQAVRFQITPRMLQSNLYYSAAVMIDSRFGIGTTHFEKGMAFQISGTVGVTDGAGAPPKVFALLQNYPNPFNPRTVVSWQLPVVSNVRLVVYDVLGREVAVLVNERKAAGSYSVEFNASGLSSGAYIYRLQAGKYMETRKLMLMR